MQISIEDTKLEQRMSKQNKPYFTQQAYAHIVNQDGSPKRYPEEITLFPQRDTHGNAVPYQKGNYNLVDASFKVERGYLTIGFVNLKKV